jgi:hypothetical protein
MASSLAGLGQQPDDRVFVRFARLPAEVVTFATDVRFASFILLHELGHRTGSYGKDDKDGLDDKNGTGPDKTARNNQKVVNACFSSQ